MSRALCRFGLKTGTENSALKMFLCGTLIVYLALAAQGPLETLQESQDIYSYGELWLGMRSSPYSSVVLIVHIMG